VFGIKLLSRVAYDLSKLFGHSAYILARHLFEHGAVAIALDELHWNIEGHQTRERFARHRAGNNIASNH